MMDAFDWDKYREKVSLVAGRQGKGEKGKRGCVVFCM
jgi:hypothetical protein